jgi:hypothetical protein
MPGHAPTRVESYGVDQMKALEQADQPGPASLDECRTPNGLTTDPEEETPLIENEGRSLPVAPATQRMTLSVLKAQGLVVA